MKKRKINGKVLLTVILLSILAPLVQLYLKEIMSVIRWLLESGILKSGVMIFIFVSTSCHSFFVEDSNLNDVPLFNSHMHWILDALLNFATYAAVSSTALSLLKGIVVQHYFQDAVYFNDFSSYDIYSMLGVSCLLLWFSVFKTAQLIKEALFYSPIKRQV